MIESVYKVLIVDVEAAHKVNDCNYSRDSSRQQNSLGLRQ